MHGMGAASSSRAGGQRRVRIPASFGGCVDGWPAFLRGSFEAFAASAWIQLLLLMLPVLAEEKAKPAPGPSLPQFLARKGFPVAPAAEPMPGYVGSASCVECHREEHGSWHASYHRTMTQRMEPGAVLGRFEGAEIRSGGYGYRLSREGDSYWSEGPDPDLLMYWVQGKKQAPPANLPRVKLPVVMATGSHHYQTYWVPSPRHPGVLQTLPVVFLRETGQWAPREAAFLHGPDDPERFVTQWNHHCILCHSTGGNPGLDEATGGLRTQVAELGISCESCHGPAGEHVALRKRTASGVIPAMDPIVNPRKLDPKRSSAVCGQCHGVFLHKDEFGFEFAKKGNLFRPGEELERTRYYPRHPRPGSEAALWADFRRNPEFFRNRWWPDGQMLAGGREYSAMRETGCYEKGGMSCLSCHSMHASDPDDQLRRDRAPGASCVDCHREPRYGRDIEQHTHHRAGSSGSDCLNCHMPHTSYALFKAIRTHQISIPKVAPVTSGGPPSACNLCHIDRSVGWTQEWLGRWYGRSEVTLPAGTSRESAMAEWMLRGHAAQRVIAAWHLGWPSALEVGGGDWIAPILASGLVDDYGPVRFVAARSLGRQKGFEGKPLDYLSPAVQRSGFFETVLQQAASRAGPEAGRPERLQLTNGALNLERLRGLLGMQDRRSITINE